MCFTSSSSSSSSSYHFSHEYINEMSHSRSRSRPRNSIRYVDSHSSPSRVHHQHISFIDIPTIPAPPPPQPIFDVSTHLRSSSHHHHHHHERALLDTHLYNLETRLLTHTAAAAAEEEEEERRLCSNARMIANAEISRSRSRANREFEDAARKRVADAWSVRISYSDNDRNDDDTASPLLHAPPLRGILKSSSMSPGRDSAYHSERSRSRGRSIRRRFYAPEEEEEEGEEWSRGRTTTVRRVERSRVRSESAEGIPRGRIRYWDSGL